VTFDVPIHEGDTVEVYEIDVQGGQVVESLDKVLVCQDATKNDCTSRAFDNLQSQGTSPIVLVF